MQDRQENSGSTDLNTLIAQDRQELETIIRQYLTSSMDNVLLVQAYCGIGKTTIIRKLVVEMDLQFIYLADRHKIVENFYRDYHNEYHARWHKDPKCVYLIGKEKACINEQGQKIIKKYGVCDWYCNKECPNRKQCSYYQNLSQIKLQNMSWCGVHKHIQNVFTQSIKKFNGLVILDENSFNSQTYRKIINLPWINETCDILHHNSVWQFFREISQCLIDQSKNDLDRIDCDILFTKINKISYSDWITNMRQIDYAIQNRYKTPHAVKRPNLIKTILPLINFLFTHPKAKGFCEIRDFMFDLLCYGQIPISSKCIVLDATLHVELNKRLFPQDTKLEHIIIDGHFLPSHTIYQLTGAECTHYEGLSIRRNSLSRHKLLKDDAKLLKEYVTLIKHIIVGYHNTLIICPKGNNGKDEIFKYITEQIQNPNVKIAYYGSLRGENDYEQCDLIILLGAYIVSSTLIMRYARLLSIDPSLIVEILMLDEMRQDFHRIRFLIRQENLTGIILNSIPFLPQEINVHSMSPTSLIRFFGGRLPVDNNILLAFLYERFLSTEVISKENLISYIKGNKEIKRKMFQLLIDRNYFSQVQLKGLNHKLTTFVQLAQELRNEIWQRLNHSMQIRVVHLSTSQHQKLSNLFKMVITPYTEIPQDILDEFYDNEILSIIADIIWQWSVN